MHFLVMLAVTSVMTSLETEYPYKIENIEDIEHVNINFHSYFGKTM